MWEGLVSADVCSVRARAKLKMRCMRWLLLVLCACMLAWPCAMLAAGHVRVAPDMRSFSSAIKNGQLDSNVEKTLYEYGPGAPGVITEQWFTGADTMDEATRIRIYVDGEETASLDFQLLLGHGIGFSEALERQHIPWSTRWLGHEADGGIYNTYRIPFGKSVRVTATHSHGGTFWYIVRGVLNFPLVIGQLQLPKTTRLRLYKNVGVVLQPYEFITLANVSESSGVLFEVMLATNSSSFLYLEACMRAHLDGSNTTTWLSSGTEDFFLSAYYFDRGVFHGDHSGLTYLDDKGAMSAYKFFETDPILFSTGLELVWRCGEEQIGTKGGCPDTFPPPEGRQKRHVTGSSALAPTNITTYVWLYQW